MRKIDKTADLARFVSKQERYLLRPSHGQVISKEFFPIITLNRFFRGGGGVAGVAEVLKILFIFQ